MSYEFDSLSNKVRQLEYSKADDYKLTDLKNALYREIEDRKHFEREFEWEKEQLRRQWQDFTQQLSDLNASMEMFLNISLRLRRLRQNLRKLSDFFRTKFSQLRSAKFFTILSK